MEHPARLRFPEQIRQQSLDFLNWFANEMFVDDPPHLHLRYLHAESEQFEYDWQPCRGVSRLTLTHTPTGTVAANTFDLVRIGDLDPARVPPPPSLLLATWVDLCVALTWITEGQHAALGDQLARLTAADTQQFGEPIYTQTD